MGNRGVGGCPDIALMMQLLPQLVPCPGHVLVALQPGERRPRIVRHSIATLQLTPSRIVEIEHGHPNGSVRHRRDASPASRVLAGAPGRYVARLRTSAHSECSDWANTSWTHLDSRR